MNKRNNLCQIQYRMRQKVLWIIIQRLMCQYPNRKTMKRWQRRRSWN